MNSAHISIRKHIHWDPRGPEGAVEPTSTVVLTSPAKRYVDIRVLRGNQPATPLLELHVKSLDKLDWAFAGTSSSLPPLGEDDEPEIVQWIHWIDSRNAKGDGPPVRDIGFCKALPDGDTLEKGSMAHPVTGKMTDYEELWGTIEVEAIGDEGKLAAVLQAGDPSTPNGPASDTSMRGMVIRVGQFIQGMVVQDGQIALERWHHAAGKWHLRVRMGSPALKLPCEHLFEPSSLAEGEEVTDHSTRWLVVEKQQSPDL